jgi:hypothetical protein
MSFKLRGSFSERPTCSHQVAPRLRARRPLSVGTDYNLKRADQTAEGMTAAWNTHVSQITPVSAE